MESGLNYFYQGEVKCYFPLLRCEESTYIYSSEIVIIFWIILFLIIIVWLASGLSTPIYVLQLTY
jgi:hypothetical protein